MATNSALRIEHVQDQPTSSDVLRVLPTLTNGIAEELRPLLRSADMEVYKHFLVTMYHYTRHAYDQLAHARDLCSGEELIKYFDQMAKEERGHYLLAKKDFEEFGGNVETTVAPSYIASFTEYWYKLGKMNVNEFVGAMYVFENVATLVGKEVVEMMERLDLTRRQSRWLRVHLEADVGHGEHAMEMCEKYVADNPLAMLTAAEEGAKEWIAVFRHAFSKQG